MKREIEDMYIHRERDKEGKRINTGRKGYKSNYKLDLINEH